jgi:hypothetical protein
MLSRSRSATCSCSTSSEAIADPLPGLAIEDFGLPDNLMIAGALLAGGHPLVVPDEGRDRAFDALDVFERHVAVAEQGCWPDPA